MLRSIFLLSLLLLSNNSFAQEEDKEKESSFLGKRLMEFKSPWTTEARPYLLWGSGIVLGLVALEDQITDPVQDETVEDKPLGSASWIGDLAGQGIPNFLYVLGMGTHYLFTKNEDSKNASIAMTQASLYSTVVAQSLKFVVHENRPDNSAGNRHYDSFPSGHTTSAFAFSSTIIAQHGLWPYGFLATLLATFAGYSRINDNRHYLHDVAGGVVLGTAYGLGISYLQQGKLYQSSEKENNVKVRRNQNQLSVAPAVDRGFYGVLVHYDFH